MDNLVYLRNTVSLTIDPSKCSGCGLCVIVCPHRVLQLRNKKAYITNKDKCMECGACEKNCAWLAISVQKGVGCATAVINGMLKKTEPSCDCSNTKCG